MERPFPHIKTCPVDSDIEALNRDSQPRRWRFAFLDFKAGCGEFARAREASLA
jgi:hypothetical protein